MSNRVLDDISLVCANFGNGHVFRAILEDWFKFLGGKPGEVVVVDGGSDAETQAVYWRAYNEGLIDKLQLIRTDHPDNSRETCFIQEHTAGAIASKKYLLWFKLDTLPYREGHDGWLAEAVGHLDRPEVYAVVGSLNYNSKVKDAMPGWYYSKKFSENFALMKRQRFIEAMSWFAGDYIASGFRGVNPGDATGQGRFLVELAIERFIEDRDLYTLCRVEEPSWTVFHTNVTGDRLEQVREKYQARQGIEKFMNAANFTAEPPGVYYGKPPYPLAARLRIWFGSTWAGPYWRAIKRKLRGAPTA